MARVQYHVMREGFDLIPGPHGKVTQVPQYRAVIKNSAGAGFRRRQIKKGLLKAVAEHGSREAAAAAIGLSAAYLGWCIDQDV
jgi:hypothetical protein